jgi:hypothetical protein
MATTFTLGLYRAEYSEDFTAQIENGCIDGLTAVDGNDNVIYVEGTAENLEKLMSLMYVYDAALIQDVFPSYKSTEEIEAEIDNAYELAFFEVQKQLIRMYGAKDGSNYLIANNDRYNKLYEAWKVLNDLNN